MTKVQGREGVERPSAIPGSRRAMRESATVRPMVKPSAPVKRLTPPAPVVLEARTFRRPVVTRGRVALPLVGFAATFAFVSGSLINPLSGAFAATASTDAVVTPAVATNIAGQQYTVTAGGGPSASRDSYTVNYTPPVVKKAPVKAATTSTTTTTTSTATATATTTNAPVAGTPDPGSAQAIAAKMVAARGWGTDQYNCLVSLWNKESGWNVYASNPSGAYGIPQALPGSKMSSAGPDWQTSAATQITWGLGYIQGHYGTPCGAWAHSEADNWY